MTRTWTAIVAALLSAAVGCSPSPTVADGSDAASDPSISSQAADDASSSTASTTTPTTATSTADQASSQSSTAPEPEPQLEPHQLDLPETPAALAAALNEAETTIRDPELTSAQLDSWGRRQQALYRHLAFNPDWADAALAAIDPTLSDAVALNWTARQNLSALVDTERLHSELPAWRVVDPLPAETLLGYYKSAEAETGIAWEFLAAINLVETRMGRIEGISTAGAIGPMQFLPTTWAECCEGDPAVPADAIAGAARYLTIRGGPDDMAKAIWGYNNSNFYVNAITAYATVMMADERAYHGYHAWEIYFRSTEGLIRIPVGYEQLEPIPATEWLAENPETLFTG